MRNRIKHKKMLVIVLSLLLLLSAGTTTFAIGQGGTANETHRHNENGWSCTYIETGKDLICTEAEMENGHQHSEECYTVSGTWSCTPSEGEGMPESDGSPESEPSDGETVQIVEFLPLADEQKELSVPFGKEIGDLSLPTKLTVKIGDGAESTVERQIDVTWTSTPEYDGEKAGDYAFAPVLPEGYAAAEGVVTPIIKVTVMNDNSLMAEDGTYQVGTADEFEKAVEEIKKKAECESTIVLKSRIELSSEFTGIEGKTVTIKSQGDTPYLLEFKDGNTLKLSGNLTFENIYISAHTIYANGNQLILGEGFGGGVDGNQRMTVYGGSDQELVANTDIKILDGVYKLVAGGNSAGTLTGNTHVEFGGSARFPNAAEGKQEGDFVSTKSENYNLYLGAKGEGQWNGPVFAGTDYEYGILPYGIYGGGTCGNTAGNTEVIMTGGTVYQIFGGGAARRNPSHAGQLNPLDDLGRVSGDTSVTVTGGEVKSVYGGGYNDIFVFSSYQYDDKGVPADVREQRAVVGGNTYVEISGNASVPAAEQDEDTSSSGADYPAVYGGSFHSTVSSTNVVIGGNAKIESGKGETYGYGAVYGAGSNDIVMGTTSVELTGNAVVGNDKNKAGASVISQGKFSAITPMGRSSESRCYLGGAIFNDLSEIRNTGSAEYAAVAEVSGGSVDVLMAGVKSRKASKQPIKTCKGNVQLIQSGGKVLSIESGSVYEKNLVIEGNVDILVTGGTTEEYILGRYRTSDLGHSEIKGNCTLKFSNCGSEDAFRRSPLIWSMDSVQVADNAHVAVFGEHTLFDSNKKPFTVPLYQVKDLIIDNGSALAFSQEADITGNLTVNGALHMARVKKSINIGGTEIPIGDSKAVTLTAAGTAKGTGQLLPIKDPESGANYGTYFEPVVNEEYVYAQTTDSDMNLTLAQGADKFFVARKNTQKAGQDVWYIAKQTPQEVTVTFDKNGGDTEADPKQIVVPKGSSVGTLPKEPTRSGYTFTGWNTESNGNGTEFTATTPVTNDITVYAQWEKAEEQLWYYDLYYQSYTPNGTSQDENGTPYNWVRQTHGQGGWNYPDDLVSISNTKFDGKQFAWDAIDGSGKETLGVHYIYDADFGPHRLSALCKEATKNNPLKIYYRTKPHTVTYQYEGEVPAGAPQVPDVVHTGYSAPVTVAANPALSGYIFSGWTVKSPSGVEIENGVLTMPNNDVVLVGTWSKDAAPPEPEKKTGDLMVSKTVSGNQGETGREFNFTVTLSDKTIGGKYGDMEFADGKATFTLKHGESRKATGLPAGITYQVTEAEANRDGYTTVSTGETGTITEAGAAASFTNTKNGSNPGPWPGPSESTGNLMVSKIVTGEKGETNRAFTFKVTLSDPFVNGVYGDMLFDAGTAVFTLKHGESKTAQGLPAGVRYIVEEIDCEGYTVTKTGDIGEIQKGETALAKFTNNRTDDGDGDDHKPEPNPDPEKPDKPDNDKPGKPDSDKPGKPDTDRPGGDGSSDSADKAPQTGDSANIGFWLAMMGIAAAGISVLAVSGTYRKKEKHSS